MIAEPVAQDCQAVVGERKPVSLDPAASSRAMRSMITALSARCPRQAVSAARVPLAIGGSPTAVLMPSASSSSISLSVSVSSAASATAASRSRAAALFGDRLPRLQP